MRTTRSLGLAAVIAALMSPGCGGGGNNRTDSGPDDGGGSQDMGQVDLGVDLLPVGSACGVSAQCAGPGTPECIQQVLQPLEEMLDSPRETARTLAEQTVITFPNNYCSTVAPCANDSECGEGGTCYLPLIDVEAAEFDPLVELLGLSDEEEDTIKGFRTYGICLEACSEDSDCTRPGYHC